MGKIIWSIRCIIAWLFRILAIAISGLVSIGIIVLGYTEPETYIKIFPMPFGGVTAGLTVFGIFVIIKSIGRLLSWTHPLDDLPRFKDYF